MMFLEMSQLSETLCAHIALERAFTRMSTQVHLEVGELTKCFAANITLIMHLAVFLLEWVWERLVASGAPMTTVWAVGTTAAATASSIWGH
jgi:precorrin-4 methylase